MYRVIIADDEPIMRKALLALVDWSVLACEVVFVAENGRELMEQLVVEKPDILISDIKMPCYSGIEIAKYIAENHLPIKIIFLTAHADFSYAQSAVKYNIVDYVIKTGVWDALVEAIEKAKFQIQNERESNRTNDRCSLKENFVKSVVFGSLFEREEIEAKFALFQEKLEEYYVIKINIMDGDESEQLKGKRREIFSQFIFDVFKTNVFIGFFIHGDQYLLVLNHMEQPMPAIQIEIQKLFEILLSFLRIRCYAGVSLQKQGASNLVAAYKEANKALMQMFTKPEKQFCLFSAEGEKARNTSSADSLIDELNRAILQGKISESDAWLGQLFAKQKEEGFSMREIKNEGLFILGLCQKALADSDTNLRTLLTVDEDKDMSKLITELWQMKAYEKQLRSIVSHTTEHIAQTANKKNLLVKACEQLIVEKYHTGITVTEIADSIGVNASYLSRLFKELTGETIINTLNKKKLEQAKYLLRNKENKIYEIAEQLGFENSTYFSHFFKKYTGITPRDFVNQ